MLTVEVEARRRCIVEGMLSKKRMTARIRITVPTRTPTPIAWRKLRTYPSSMEKIPARLAIGMQITARNIERCSFISIPLVSKRPTGEPWRALTGYLKFRYPKIRYRFQGCSYWTAPPCQKRYTVPSTKFS